MYWEKVGIFLVFSGLTCTVLGPIVSILFSSDQIVLSYPTFVISNTGRVLSAKTFLLISDIINLIFLITSLCRLSLAGISNYQYTPFLFPHRLLIPSHLYMLGG